MKRVTAFAPATIGNFAVGYDILGACIEGPGDYATVWRAPSGVKILDIEGVDANDIPAHGRKNTASAALFRLMQELDLDHGFELTLKKGISLGSGLGGSAASAVAAVTAAAALIEPEVDRETLVRAALAGEETATRAAHPDNVVPCLFGGLRLTLSVDPFRDLSLTVPDDLAIIMAHPNQRLETAAAREAVPGRQPLVTITRQMALLAGFMDATYRGDARTLCDYCMDVMVEPFRASLVTGFHETRDAALHAGARSFGLSGAGPSVFALATMDDDLEKIAAAMENGFRAAGVQARVWTSAIRKYGATLCED